MDRPKGEETRTVSVSVTHAGAPGLRQFLNRRSDAVSEPEAEASPGPVTEPLELSGSSLGALLLATDAVVVVLSFVLLVHPASAFVRAIGCVGMVAGAALGLLGVTVMSRRR
jgi:hypothetical protein